MRKSYETPELSIVQIRNESDVMALKSAAVPTTGAAGIYNTTTFGTLK